MVGRWLSIWGFDVTLCTVVEPKTTDAIKNAQRCQRLGISTISWSDVSGVIDTKKNLVLVESILGTCSQNALYQDKIFFCVDNTTHIRPRNSGYTQTLTSLGIFDSIGCFGFNNSAKGYIESPNA